jgi:cytochrome c oxidase cbb3-type subunit III
MTSGGFRMGPHTASPLALVLGALVTLSAASCGRSSGSPASPSATPAAQSAAPTVAALESATDEVIAAGIRMGRPGSAMAAYGKVRGGPLEEAEIKNLVAFFRSKGPAPQALPPLGPDGDSKRGAEVFEKNCQSCHGTTTMRGNALNLFNPELLAAASPAFLKYAVVNGRAPTPMPAFQGKLSEQEVTDVVSCLWSF